MKTPKIFILVSIVAASFLFAGCPYSSTVPLSADAMKPWPNLIGTWEQSGDENTTIVVEKAENNRLMITKTVKNQDAEPTVESYEGYLSDVNGTLFLNLNDDALSESDSYYIYKIEKDGEFKMTIYEVTANIRETFTSSEEMKAFFIANMKNSYFYNTDELKYFKVK